MIQTDLFNSPIVQVRDREVAEVIEDNDDKQQCHPSPSESEVKTKVNKY